MMRRNMPVSSDLRPPASRIARQLESNLASIENDYAAGMRQTDINARQSAVNNEEKLAALGLNMGARGQPQPPSGMAETSRIAVDNRYRSDLNALGQARLHGACGSAGHAADGQEAAARERATIPHAENAALQQAQAALSAVQRRPRLRPVGSRSDRLPERHADAELAQLPAECQQCDRECTDAAPTSRRLSRWKTSGYVRQGDAAILGVPAGTPTADVSYQNAALALQRWKNGYGG